MEPDLRPFQSEVVDALEALTNLRSVRLVMACARRAGVPYSLALQMWSSSADLAMEEAYDRHLGQEGQERCPDCHTRRDEVYGEDGRPLEWGYWKWELHSCETCATGERLNRDLQEGNRSAVKAYYRLVPRGLGDDYIERFNPGE